MSVDPKFQDLLIEKMLILLGQVAYLMADISDVSNAVIKDLYQRLEGLNCKSSGGSRQGKSADALLVSTYHDQSTVLRSNLSWFNTTSVKQTRLDHSKEPLNNGC